MIYLACPYSHPDAAVRNYRFRNICRIAAALMREGYVVFSPLSHSVPIAEIGGIDDVDNDFWLAQDLPILRKCDELIVVELDGWESSKGVQAEIEEAKRLNIPIQNIEVIIRKQEDDKDDAER